jgi:oligoribonuclease
MTEQPGDLLVWMDMEMSGLDVDRDAILEIATLISTNELEVVAEGPVIAVAQPASLLESMNDWNRQHHAASGLSQRVLASSVGVAEAEATTLAFVRRHVGEHASPLCGNSIHQDRRFLTRYMPKLDAYLHYRNVDVSTVKELVRRWYPGGPEAPQKKHAHLALDDIRESIDELRFYRRHFFR